MGNRQIKDAHGAVWDVWDVNPGATLGFAAYDRRSGTRGEPPPADGPAVMLHAELKHGWLCFQTGSERRRFAPIPAGWFELSEAVLLVMLDVARPVAMWADVSTNRSAAE